MSDVPPGDRWLSTSSLSGWLSTCQAEDMPNQHEHATRTFRPDICLEYAPAQETLSAAGIDMNRFLRACLRWLVADTTTVLAGLEPFLPPQPTKGAPEAPRRP
jgi:hypothetical protein